MSDQIVSMLLPETDSSSTECRHTVCVVTAPARRPGPRSDVDVPAALVDAAEQLFGGASVDAVSLRSVARAAGVAPAALTHYFPDKTALVEAVLQRRAEPVGEEVRERLVALVEAEDDPQRRATWSRPSSARSSAILDDDPVAGLAWMKLFTALGLAEEPDLAARGRAVPEHRRPVRRGAAAGAARRTRRRRALPPRRASRCTRC